MLSSRHSLLLYLGVLVGGFSLLPRHENDSRADNGWRGHPALAEPDGRSHRGDKMVAAEINDRRVLEELVPRFRQTEPLRLVNQNGETVVRGGGDFEKRQEYLLRLLDYFWFSKPRLTGMTWAEVDRIFGPLGPMAEQASVSAGRDMFWIWFKDGRVSGAFYAIGY